MSQSKPAKSGKLSWPPILKRKYPSGKKAWQISVMVNGVRVRETFSTKAEAETRADQMRIARQNEGAAAFSIPSDVRAEAARCVEKLRPSNTSLSTAVDYYIEHVLAYRNAPTVREIVKKLLEEKEKGNRRPATLLELKHRLGHFANAFGNRHLSEITPDEVAAWIEKVTVSPVSYRNYRVKLIQLWRYAIRRKWCVENAAEQTQRPEVDETVPGILSVEQCARLLEQAPDFGMIPYAILGLFCGVRTNELNRLTWQDVNLAGRTITIGPKVAKKRRQRIIPLSDTAVGWLTAYAQRSGPIVEVYGNRPKRFNQWRTAAGIKEWPNNALRHSFGSYHFAMYGDAIKTAMLMGHRNPDVFHNHYKALVTEAEAKRFWALRPATAESEKIVPLTATAAG